MSTFCAEPPTEIEVITKYNGWDKYDEDGIGIVDKRASIDQEIHAKDKNVRAHERRNGEGYRSGSIQIIMVRLAALETFSYTYKGCRLKIRRRKKLANPQPRAKRSSNIPPNHRASLTFP